MLQFREVMFDGRLEDGMRRVEVAVCESVAHGGDLIPWNRVLVGEECAMEALHGLADFNKPYPHGVEDQSVAELAAGQMAADGLDRSLMSSSRCCS